MNGFFSLELFSINIQRCYRYSAAIQPVKSGKYTYSMKTNNWIDKQEHDSVKSYFLNMKMNVHIFLCCVTWLCISIVSDVVELSAGHRYSSPPLHNRLHFKLLLIQMLDNIHIHSYSLTLICWRFAMLLWLALINFLPYLKNVRHTHGAV